MLGLESPRLSLMRALSAKLTAAGFAGCPMSTVLLCGGRVAAALHFATAEKSGSFLKRVIDDFGFV